MKPTFTDGLDTVIAMLDAVRDASIDAVEGAGMPQAEAAVFVRGSDIDRMLLLLESQRAVRDKMRHGYRQLRLTSYVSMGLAVGAVVIAVLAYVRG